MNPDEVLGLLIYANELDGRHSPNEAKVLSWSEVLNSGAPGMTLDFAKEQVTRHYGLSDQMLAPSVLVTAWKQYQRSVADARIARGSGHEAHCGRGGCLCTHSDECFKGWIDHDGGTAPCPICRPSLADAIYAMPEPGDRNQHDYATLRNRMWGDNDER